MGLDMYLRKKINIGNQYRDPAKQVKVIVPEDQDGVFFPTPAINQEKLNQIEELVGYWRKANAIHKWFVDNVQEGEDDCKEYYVSFEKLQGLLETVNTVLAASVLVDGEINTGYTLDANYNRVSSTE